MNITPHPLSLRRAALAVHAMSTLDREWLLRELPEPERRRLQPLLAEIGEIGIPRDGSLLREAALEGSAAQDVPPVQAPAASISARSARSLVRWLRAQPGHTAARLLAASPAWRSRILLALPRAERAPLERLAASLSPAPELERWVEAAARRHIDAEAASPRPVWLRVSGWWPLREVRR